MQKIEFIDIFCGAGLFSAGFASVGFSPRLAIDLSADAVASYRRNVAPVALSTSVSEFNDIPQCDILIAGPPCQGFSTLGRQDPLDSRNELALEVVRWANLSNASVVVIENVPPFLGSPQWATVALGLRRLDYQIQTWILDAAEFGTAQRRKRAFTIASRIGCIDEPRRLSVTATVGDILARPIDSNDPMHRWPTPKGIAAERIALLPQNGDKRDIMKVAPQLCPPSWAKVGCQATDVWGRMDAKSPSNTLRCAFQNPSKGRYIHPSENRCLSLREGARIQGVADDWLFEGSNCSVARQIGNGVPIQLGTAVARSIRKSILEVTTEKALT